jgi:hypothetical protein
MTDYVETIVKWARSKPLIATVIMICIVCTSLLGMANLATSMYASIQKIRADAAERDNPNRKVLVKLETGTDVELTRLAERLVEKSNVTSYVWGDYLIDANYYGWSFSSNTLVYSGSVENVKSPIKLKAGVWQLRLVLHGDWYETQFSFTDGDGYTLEDIMKSPENNYYYNQWVDVQVQFINALKPQLISHTISEMRDQPKPTLWRRIFRKR